MEQVHGDLEAVVELLNLEMPGLSQESESMSPTQIPQAVQVHAEIHSARSIREGGEGDETYQASTKPNSKRMRDVSPTPGTSKQARRLPSESIRVVDTEEEEWFQPAQPVTVSKRNRKELSPAQGTSKKAARHHTGGKNLEALRESLRSPLPSPSAPASSPSVVGFSQEDEDMLDAERRRRREEALRRSQWEKEALRSKAGLLRQIENSAARLSELRGERNALQKQVKGYRQQIQAAEALDASLEERERAISRSSQKLKERLAKFNEMGI